MEIVFLKGIITGLVLSLPFGPIGIYCMEKTLVEGEKEGYISAMGMVTIDFVYGMFAFLFINILKDDIEKYGPILAGFIGIFLVKVGSSKFLKKMESADIKERKGGLLQYYLTTMFVAILNISSIVVIMMVWTISDPWLKVSPAIDSYIATSFFNKLLTGVCFSGGIFIGGGALWFLTTYILFHWRKKITHDILVKITKYSGLILLLFGLFTIFNSIRHFLMLQNIL